MNLPLDIEPGVVLLGRYRVERISGEWNGRGRRGVGHRAATPRAFKCSQESISAMHKPSSASCAKRASPSG